MLYPFDHVHVGDVEFILWYRGENVHFDGTRPARWTALDMYMNKVGLEAADMTVLPSQCTNDGIWIHRPRFYRDKFQDGRWLRHAVHNVTMYNSVREGHTHGQFEEDGVVWKWDTRALFMSSGSEKWLLRIMTPGGVWL